MSQLFASGGQSIGTSASALSPESINKYQSSLQLIETGNDKKMLAEF